MCRHQSALRQKAHRPQHPLSVVLLLETRTHSAARRITMIVVGMGVEAVPLRCRREPTRCGTYPPNRSVPADAPKRRAAPAPLAWISQTLLASVR